MKKILCENIHFYFHGSKLNIFRNLTFFFATAIKITENHVRYENLET